MTTQEFQVNVTCIDCGFDFYSIVDATGTPMDSICPDCSREKHQEDMFYSGHEPEGDEI